MEAVSSDWVTGRLKAAFFAGCGVDIFVPRERTDNQISIRSLFHTLRRPCLRRARFAGVGAGANPFISKKFRFDGCFAMRFSIGYSAFENVTLYLITLAFAFRYENGPAGVVPKLCILLTKDPVRIGRVTIFRGIE